MEDKVRARVAWALKCELSEVPEDPKEMKTALENRRAELKAAKVVKHGQPIH